VAQTIKTNLMFSCNRDSCLWNATQHNTAQYTDREVLQCSAGAYVLAVIPRPCLSALPQTSLGLNPNVVYAYQPVTIITYNCRYQQHHLL